MVNQALLRVTPRPVKEAAKIGIRATKRGRSLVELAATKRELRRKYGPAVDLDSIDEHDEMHQFMVVFWHWPHHVVPMRAESDAT